MANDVNFLKRVGVQSDDAIKKFTVHYFHIIEWAIHLCLQYNFNPSMATTFLYSNAYGVQPTGYDDKLVEKIVKNYAFIPSGMSEMALKIKPVSLDSQSVRKTYDMSTDSVFVKNGKVASKLSMNHIQEIIAWCYLITDINSRISKLSISYDGQEYKPDNLIIREMWYILSGFLGKMYWDYTNNVALDKMIGVIKSKKSLIPDTVTFFEKKENESVHPGEYFSFNEVNYKSELKDTVTLSTDIVSLFKVISDPIVTDNINTNRASFHYLVHNILLRAFSYHSVTKQFWKGTFGVDAPSSCEDAYNYIKGSSSLGFKDSQICLFSLTKAIHEYVEIHKESIAPETTWAINGLKKVNENGAIDYLVVLNIAYDEENKINIITFGALTEEQKNEINILPRIFFPRDSSKYFLPNTAAAADISYKRDGSPSKIIDYRYIKKDEQYKVKGDLLKTASATHNGLVFKNIITTVKQKDQILDNSRAGNGYSSENSELVISSDVSLETIPEKGDYNFVKLTCKCYRPLGNTVTQTVVNGFNPGYLMGGYLDDMKDNIMIGERIYVGAIGLSYKLDLGSYGKHNSDPRLKLYPHIFESGHATKYHGLSVVDKDALGALNYVIATEGGFGKQVLLYSSGVYKVLKSLGPTDLSGILGNEFLDKTATIHSSNEIFLNGPTDIDAVAMYKNRISGESSPFFPELYKVMCPAILEGVKATIKVLGVANMDKQAAAYLLSCNLPVVNTFRYGLFIKYIHNNNVFNSSWLQYKYRDAFGYKNNEVISLNNIDYFVES